MCALSIYSSDNKTYADVCLPFCRFPLNFISSINLYHETYWQEYVFVVVNFFGCFPKVLRKIEKGISVIITWVNYMGLNFAQIWDVTIFWCFINNNKRCLKPLYDAPETKGGLSQTELNIEYFCVWTTFYWFNVKILLNWI